MAAEPEGTVQVIDVLVAIDAQTIVDNYPGSSDSNNPAGLSSNANVVFAVTDYANTVSGSGTNELTISAKVDDFIRWRETSLDLNFDWFVLFYNFVPDSGGGLISTPTANLATRQVPLPNPKTPTTPSSQTVQNYSWYCQVNDTGEVTYHFWFMILDQNGKVQGYWSWDPFIQISN